jgi:drug/metabolite transporter (DMT)-like permease
MPTTRRPIDAQALGIMVLLCLTWGFQQVAMKSIAAEVTPLMQIAIRSAAATVVVAALMWRGGEPVLVRDATTVPGLMAGMLFAIEFVLVGEGLRHTTASHMVVFLYTAPIFAALGLHATLPSERLHALQWFGIALAFVGITVTFFLRSGTNMQAAAGNMLLGDALALLAGAAWGATTVVIRNSALAQASAKRSLLYQLACAAVLPAIVAMLMGQTGVRGSPFVWANLTFQTLVVCVASFLAWFWLLRRYLASRLGVFSFLTPLFGVGFGVWLLGETVEPSFLIGSALVLAGIVMVSGYDWVRAWGRHSG